MQLWPVVLLSGTLAVPAHAVSLEARSGQEYAENMLVLSRSDFDVRLAAKSLHRRGGGNPSTMDLLAEVVWTACSGRRAMHPDALSWSAKALGTTGQARYATLLDDCLTRVENKNTLSHLQEARARLTGSATSPFAGGTVDLGQARDRLARRADAVASESLARQFKELRGGRTLEDVYAEFGRPTDVKGVSVPGRRIGHGVVKVRVSWDMIVFVYPGLGEVLFSYDDEKKDWRLAEAKGAFGQIWVHGTGRFGTLDDQITEGDTGDLRDAVKRLRKHGRIEPTTFDRIADRIYRSHTVEDDDLADTVAWLCRILGTSGDGRYRKLLDEVSDAAVEKAVRKHAGKAADDLPKSSAEPYVPVLATQRL